MRILVIFALLGATSPGLAAPTSMTPWRLIKPGPHSVGFKSFFTTDTSRDYPQPDTASSGRVWRPILVNVWYPAGATGRPTLQARDYFSLPTPPAGAATFASQLARLQLEVVKSEVSESPDRYLDTKTTAVRNAPEADGKFPVLFYHPGLRGSFADDAPLLELLASHGFIVIDSAYEPSSAWAVSIDADLRRSQDDLGFLLQLAHSFAHADAQHVGVIGHSFGASAVLSFALSNRPVEAVVSLDSTLDYFEVAELGLRDDRDWGLLVDGAGLTIPLLAAAGNQATFKLVDRWIGSDRWLLRTADLEHDDFIWHGIAGALLSGPAEAEKKRQQYEALATYVLHFFEAKLKGSGEAEAFLRRSPAENQLPGDITVETRAGRASAVTPVQVIGRLLRDGASSTLAFLRERERAAPGSVAEGTLQRAAMGLQDRDRADGARLLLQLNVELHPLSAGAELEWGDALATAGRSAESRSAYQQALRKLALAPPVDSVPSAIMVAAMVEAKLAQVPGAQSTAADARNEMRAAIQRKEYDRCSALNEKAAALSMYPANDLYNAACCYALAGHRDRAFDALERAVGAGFRLVRQLERDNDLGSLRADRRWAFILRRAQVIRTSFIEGVDREIYQLFVEQAEERSAAGTSQSSDAWRRDRVTTLVAGGRAKTAEDYYYAALVLAGSDREADLRRGQEWCARARALDPSHLAAARLAATLADRLHLPAVKRAR
jgi:hypothetical protein